MKLVFIHILDRFEHLRNITILHLYIIIIIFLYLYRTSSFDWQDHIFNMDVV